MYERREFIRLGINAEVEYTIKDSNNPPKLVLLKNISKAGISIITGEIIDKNVILELKLKIAGILKPVHIKGKIIWNRKVLNEAAFEQGIQIIRIPAGDKKFFWAFIEAMRKAKERREFVRCNLSVPVKCKLGDDFTVEKECLSIDICAAGIKVQMNEKLDFGVEMQLIFTLPEDRVEIITQGVIIWVKKVKKIKKRETDCREAGIQFINLNARDAARISEFVSKTLKLL